MDRLYNLLDEFIYSKTLAGRVNNFIKDCKAISAKICATANTLKKVPVNTYNKVKTGVQTTYANAKAKVQEKVASYKESLAAVKAE